MIKQHKWSIFGGRELGPAPFFIVGIVNITTDSFYDGGKFFDPHQAFDQIKKMIKQGADIVDIGGESTRPFSKRIDYLEELSRIRPVLNKVRDEFPGTLVSVDTYKSEVAKRVLQEGASIINDVSAVSLDPELINVLAEYKPGYVLMHSQGRPEEMQKNPHYNNVIQELLQFFEEHLNKLTKAGLPEENIVLDPGIGFGKLLEHNLSILKNIERFFVFGRPIFIGLSNKSMWRKLLGLESSQRKNVTQVATALLANKGVGIHRVHEVDLTWQTLRVVQELQ